MFGKMREDLKRSNGVRSGFVSELSLAGNSDHSWDTPEAITFTSRLPLLEHFDQHKELYIRATCSRVLGLRNLSLDRLCSDLVRIDVCNIVLHNDTSSRIWRNRYADSTAITMQSARAHDPFDLVVLSSSLCHILGSGKQWEQSLNYTLECRHFVYQCGRPRCVAGSAKSDNREVSCSAPDGMGEGPEKIRISLAGMSQSRIR